VILDGKVPSGPIGSKWQDFKGHANLVNPANRRKHNIVVVGTGLAGASAAARLGEMG
jgi:succinate dehydrogenase / fumarate reductase flavoprotein subunit